MTKKLIQARNWEELQQSSDWKDLTGELRIPLKNDYLFKAMLQRNEKVLRAVIASVLHRDITEITSAHVENPIEMGSRFDAKTFILDVKVTVNGDTIVTIEMQVLREPQWPERSLGYLCRAFDQLNRGDDYIHTKAAIQIGFLDFTLFQDDPKFFSEYRLLDTVTQRIYTDKFRLYVVNLKKAGQAEQAECGSGLNGWAALFAATTWEELKMLSQTEPMLDEAIGTAYQLMMDQQEYYRMEAREDTLIHERVMKEQMEAAVKGREEAERNFAEAEKKLSEVESRNEELTAEVARLKKLLEGRQQ